MPIDDCSHTFEQLASTVLRGYMAELRRRMRRPVPMSDFAVKGVGAKTLLRQFGRDRDFEGCYVFLDGARPVYVGISRSVFQRLIQHVKGSTHFDASLAYRMAERSRPHDLTRSQAMKNAGFQRRFDDAQSYLRGLSVAFIEIQNPLELYLFEAYCAIELDTGEWNTFRTH